MATEKESQLARALQPSESEEVDLFALIEASRATLTKLLTAVPLGNYEKYRGTARWRRIKARVLERDKRTCLCCGGIGTVVHHRSYDDDVMLGTNDAMLWTVCDGCHELIHFTDDGAKRSAEEVDLLLLAGQLQTSSSAERGSRPSMIQLKRTCASTARITSGNCASPMRWSSLARSLST